MDSVTTDWLFIFDGVEVLACEESFKCKWGSPTCPARNTQSKVACITEREIR